MESFDHNFRLSILNSLIENGRVDKASLEHFLAEKAGKTLAPAQAEEDEEDEEDEEAAVKAAIDILSSYPVSADDWASIESIRVDGGDEIYFVIEPFLEISTGGESDYYYLRERGRPDALRLEAQRAQIHHPDVLSPRLARSLVSLEASVRSRIFAITLVMHRYRPARITAFRRRDSHG